MGAHMDVLLLLLLLLLLILFHAGGMTPKKGFHKKIGDLQSWPCKRSKEFLHIGTLFGHKLGILSSFVICMYSVWI